MMLRYTFGLSEEADAIDSALAEVLRKGWRTPDLFVQGSGKKLMGTKEAGTRIAEELDGRS